MSFNVAGLIAERDELQKKLESAEAERDALKARIEEAEKQEPMYLKLVAKPEHRDSLNSDEQVLLIYPNELKDYNDDGIYVVTKLYAAPIPSPDTQELIRTKERYEARRHEIYRLRMRLQISGQRITEEEFNAEYDAACDKDADAIRAKEDK